MAKGDDAEARRALHTYPFMRSDAPQGAERMTQLLGELYDLIDSPKRTANQAPQQREERTRRRIRFIVTGTDLCRALALGMRGR